MGMPAPGQAGGMDNQSCCCPSRAVARVIMPPTAERPHEVELLLCGHHLRQSQGTLAAAGAEIYVMPGEQGAELALLLANASQLLQRSPPDRVTSA